MKNAWDVWKNNKHICKITYNKYYKEFYITMNGYIDGFSFKSSKDLIKKMSTHYCELINIPKDVLEEIDSICMLNMLGGDM